MESFHVFPSDLPGGLGGSVARRVVPSGLEDSVVRRVVSSGREAGGGVAALGADTAVADEVFVAGRPSDTLGGVRGLLVTASRRLVLSRARGDVGVSRPIALSAQVPFCPTVPKAPQLVELSANCTSWRGSPCQSGGFGPSPAVPG